MRDCVYVYVGLTSSRKGSCVLWWNGEPDDPSTSGT